MSKTYFNAFNESEFYCITFRFYCPATPRIDRGRKNALNSKCWQDRKKFRFCGENRKNRWQSKNTSHRKNGKLAHNKGHLNCQLWWHFLGISIPQKKHFCIHSNFAGDGSRKYALHFSSWLLPLPNSFDQKLKLYFGAQPAVKRSATQGPKTRDMFSGTAAATKAFSHKGCRTQDARWWMEDSRKRQGNSAHVACRSTQCQQIRSANAVPVRRNNDMSFGRTFARRAPRSPLAHAKKKKEKPLRQSILHALNISYMCGGARATKWIRGRQYWQGQSCIVGRPKKRSGCQLQDISQLLARPTDAKRKRMSAGG